MHFPSSAKCRPFCSGFQIFNNSYEYYNKSDVTCWLGMIGIWYRDRSSMAKINTSLRLDALCWFRSSHGPFFCHSLQQLFVPGILKRMNPIPVLQSNNRIWSQRNTWHQRSYTNVEGKLFYVVLARISREDAWVQIDRNRVYVMLNCYISILI